MKIIGVTGPSGGGKSYLCREFRARGIPVLDADAIYHEMLLPPSETVRAVADALGENLLMPDGSLDRKALASLVFSDKEKLSLLNRTVFPLIRQEIAGRIASLGEKEDIPGVCVLDAPTLIESGIDADCTLVVAVVASHKVRAARIQARDGITETQALARIAAQPDDAFYLEKADVVLHENYDPAGSADEILTALKEK